MCLFALRFIYLFIYFCKSYILSFTFLFVTSCISCFIIQKHLWKARQCSAKLASYELPLLFAANNEGWWHFQAKRENHVSLYRHTFDDYFSQFLFCLALSKDCSLDTKDFYSLFLMFEPCLSIISWTQASNQNDTI